MTVYQILDSSPQAIELDKSLPSTRGFTEKYPWRALQIGQSFTIPLNDMTEEKACAYLLNIQNQSYRKNKQLERTFRVLFHKEINTIEVARRPDPVIVGNSEKPLKNKKVIDFGFDKSEPIKDVGAKPMWNESKEDE